MLQDFFGTSFYTNNILSIATIIFLLSETFFVFGNSIKWVGFIGNVVAVVAAESNKSDTRQSGLALRIGLM
jgi:hypothetical protein